MNASKYVMLNSVLSNIKNLKKVKPGSEDEICNEISNNLKSLTLSGELDAVWFHIPNEFVGESVKDIARTVKQMANGLIPGAPDYVIISKNKTMFVEVKTEKGKQSDTQKLFEEWVKSCGMFYTIVRSWTELLIDLEQYFIEQVVFLDKKSSFRL